MRKKLAGLVSIAILSGAVGGYAEALSPLQVYKEIKGVVLEADHLAMQGKASQAKGLYEQAQARFATFKKQYASWDSLVLVDIQMDLCKTRLKSLEMDSPKSATQVEKECRLQDSVTQMPPDAKAPVPQAASDENQASTAVAMASTPLAIKKMVQNTEDDHQFELWLERAEKAFAKSNFKEAAYCYDRAMQLKQSVELYLNRAVSLFKSSETQKALDSMQTAMDRYPNDFLLRYNYADMNYALGHLEEAETAYLAALKIQPDNIETRLNVGVVLVDMGRYNEALDYFLAVLKQNPFYPAVNYNLAVLYNDFILDKEKANFYMKKYEALSKDND